MILDKDPITFLCDCGRKDVPKRTAAEINKLIDSKKLSATCTPIKGKK